jgi:hypothetical protein
MSRRVAAGPRLLLGAGLCSVLLPCCQRPAESAPAQVPPQTESPVSPPAAADSALTAPKGEAVSFAAELETVSKLRGLQSKADISGLRVDGPDLINHVRQSFRLERPEEALTGTESMLVALSVVPMDFNFEVTLLRLLSSNLAGLYEPRLKLMLVKRDLAPAEAQVTLLHELVHALQDQYYDLSEVVEYREDDSDLSSAISSLAEGDATSAMLDGVLPNGQTALSIPESVIEKLFFSQTVKVDAPPIVIRSLYAPYLDGLRFVHQLRRQGGWSKVDEAWQRPPQSTEQVLHLEKFEAREQPIEVAVPRPPKDGWKLVFHDIWGEQSLRILLEEWLGRDEADRAASGWGGDRIALFEKDGCVSVAWSIETDTEGDARELESGFKSGLTFVSSDPTEDVGSEEQMRCGKRKDGHSSLLLSRNGRHIELRSAPIKRADGESLDCGFFLTSWGQKEPTQ